MPTNRMIINSLCCVQMTEKHASVKTDKLLLLLFTTIQMKFTNMTLKGKSKFQRT